ncbi:MAG: phosphate ABC transporter permease subunit PstC [Archangium sp.]|nr:phosphate ABC transporter permease subunit PstC [Archangium sp.]
MKRGGVKLGERLIEALIVASGWSSIVCMAAIFVFLVREAAPVLPRIDWVEFFTSTRWIPAPASGNAPHYGALALMVGTLTTTLVALLVAIPAGLGAAVYLSEFASDRLRETFKVIIELLAAVPSIVWGFVGLMLVGPVVARVTGAPLGTNLLTGGVVLGLISAPVIVSIAEDALRAVPDSYREAALALGASRWELVYRVLFPAARNGLLAACLLGLGRALGETMAVLLATGHANQLPHSLVDPVRTMTAAIAAELGEAPRGSEHYHALFVLGVVLLIFTFAVNVAADLVIKGTRREQR